MVMMLGGSVSEVNEEQPWKAISPISIIVGGSVSEAKEVQSLNALSPMV